MADNWKLSSSGTLDLNKADLRLKGLQALFEYGLKTETIQINSAKSTDTGAIAGKSNIWDCAETEVIFTFNSNTQFATGLTLTKPIDNFGTFDLPLGIRIDGWKRRVEVQVFNDGDSDLSSTIGIVFGTIHIGDKISVPFRIENPSDNSRFWIDAEFDSSIGGKHEGLGLDDLSSLFYEGDTKQDDLDLLPRELLDSIARGIRLASIRIRFDTKNTPHLVSAAIRFSLLENAFWNVIPGLFAVGGLWVELDVEYPLESDYRFPMFKVGGALLFGAGTPQQQQAEVDITARWPDLQIQGALREGQSIQVGRLLQNLGISVPDAFEKLAIDRLAFSAEPTSDPKTFAFYINIRDVLDLGKFKIESLSLAIDYSGAQTAVSDEDSAARQPLPARLDGRFHGRFQLFGIEFYVSTERVSAGTTGAWIFEGSADASGTNVEKLVGEFTSTANIPAWLKGMTIRQIDLKYNTRTKDFSFECDVDAKALLGDGTDAELIVNVDLKRTNPDAAAGVAAVYERTLSGQLIFTLDKGLQLEFDILFDQGGADTTFIAAYRNLAGGDVNIGALTQKLGGPNVPLTIQMKDAYFIYDKTANANQANLLFGLDIGGGINLSNLPLIGRLFPDSQTLKISLQPLIASGTPDAQKIYFSKTELARLQGLVPGGGILLPVADVIAPLSLAVNLEMGDMVKRLDLPVALDDAAKPVPAGQTPPAPLSAGNALKSTGNADVSWFDIQRSFGPVQFSRIGLAFQNSRIYGYLDASMSLGGLVLTLDGLSVSNPLNAIDPKFSLQGLGIDFKEGDIEIGGSFLRTTVTTGNGAPYDEYDGMAILKAGALNVAAIGSYARVNGQHSLFIFAALNYPIGGPAFFFVTGLAAGFGYNRKLRAPDITQVAQFPLVEEVVKGAGASPPGDDAGRRSYIQSEIVKLRDYIFPYDGENILAAGIRFSSFRMVDSFALVCVNFGQHFDISVLGLSTLVVPTPTPGSEPPPTPVAEAQMALKAAFDPEAGILSVEAQLTSDSYLFSKKCHLTGGFAFYSWFDGPHKGDFVISLGGYHPMYQVPAHYPKVPRLGYNWTLNDNFSIKGEGYFALTAHALMAGGKLEALYQKDDLKAWFVIGADFIISWKPYFYDARMYLDIGASYTFHVFGTHTISISVGADLHIWGPEFSGVAEVDLHIVKFTVRFGDASPKPRPIDWNTFQASFLPEQDKVVSPTVVSGLVRQQGDSIVINPKELVLSVHSMVPVRTYELNLTKGIAKDKKDQLYFTDAGKQFLEPIGNDMPESATAVPTGDFGIAPMNVAKVSGSAMSITIRDEKNNPVNSDFAFTPVLKRMPRAMWGDQLTAETNGRQFVENALAGFDIHPAKPVNTGITHAVLKTGLQYEPDLLQNTFYCPEAMSSAGIVLNDAKRLDNITKVTGNRNAMLKELGFHTESMNLSIPPDIKTMFVR